MNSLTQPYFSSAFKSNVILDHFGLEIKQGSIVKCWDEEENPSIWTEHQGVVVTPYTHFGMNWREGYTVPVFYNLEVDESYLHPHSLKDLKLIGREWDEEHEFLRRNDNLDFLFEEEGWKLCPRIRFFKPDELMVCDGWDVRQLVSRVFKGNFHHTNILKKEYCPSVPSKHTCHSVDCNTQASYMTLINIWGSVCNAFMCDVHHQKYHGAYMEQLPTKSILLDSSGKAFVHAT